MDWENEPYVRLYIRDTADLLAIGWEGRAVLSEVMRKCSRAGVLDIVDPDVLADLLRMPRDIVAIGVGRLLERGTFKPGWLNKKPCIVLPNFLAAQEASQSDRQRKKEQRQRARDKALLDLVVCPETGHLVPKPDADVTKRDTLSGERATMSLLAMLSSAKQEEGAVAEGQEPLPLLGPKQESSRRKPKHAQAKQETHDDRKPVMDAWTQAYHSAYGEKPQWLAKERAAANRLAKTHGAAKVQERIGRLFSSPPKWLDGPFTIHTLEKHWNSLVEKPATPVPVEHARMERWS